MRVLQVLGSLHRGGAETMIMNVYRKIDKEKVQFDFLVMERVDNGYEDDVRSMGGNILFVPRPSKLRIFKYIKDIKNIMIENGPYDIIHSHINSLSGISLLAAKLANIKCRISHSHSNNQPFWYLKILNLLMSTNRIACSNEAGKALFFNKEFKVIPNGIDINKFLPNREKCKNDDGIINLCHIGRFVPLKNHKFLIAISKLLRENNIKFRLYLVGNGPIFDEIVNEVKQNYLDEYIIFVGSTGDVSSILEKCNLFLLPSFYEGLPVTLIEAQASGLPCLVSNNVSKDSDLGLGLVDFLELSISEWYDYIVSRSYKRIYDKNKITRVFTAKKYDINISSNMLIEEYYNIIEEKKNGEKKG